MQRELEKVCTNVDAALLPISNRLAVVELRLSTLATTFDQFRRSVNAERIPQRFEEIDDRLNILELPDEGRTEKRLRDLEQSMNIVANILQLHRAAIVHQS